MQIFIQARSFSLTSSLRNYAKQKLESSLSYGEDYLQRVVIRLSDINGPRGGEDKRCHIQIVLAGLPDVIIEDTEQDMYAAIEHAATRAGHAVTRKVKRQKTLLRQERHKIAALTI